jgi:hypothetical protein
VKNRLPFALILLTLLAIGLVATLLPTQAALGKVVQAVEVVLSQFPDWITEGGYTGVEYGSAVASAGDIDGDGYSDVLVGAQKYLVDGERVGAVFVFRGASNGLSSSLHRMLTSRVNGSFFGGAVGSAGDVNGDGYDDVIIGAPHHHANLGYDGAAYVYYGSITGLSETPGWSQISPAGNAQFGFSVASAGDVDGDGYDDVLVGARAYSAGHDNEGAVYLFLGSANGLKDRPTWVYESNQAGALLGIAVTGMGDLNQDGYHDIAISAPYYDQGHSDNGVVWIFTGSSSGLGSAPDWSASGSQPDERFGSSIASAGDVDGNNYSDLLVGAQGYDCGQVDNGAAYVFYNAVGNLNMAASWQVCNSQAYSGFGISVAGLGDANGDGYADIVVGAPRYSDDQPQEGMVYVYSGSSIGVGPNASWFASGDKAETDFGYSVAGAGDVNGDQQADLMIGAPIYKKDERIVMGRAYAFNGTESAEPVPYRLHLPLLISN